MQNPSLPSRKKEEEITIIPAGGLPKKKSAKQIARIVTATPLLLDAILDLRAQIQTHACSVPRSSTCECVSSNER